MDRYQEEIGTVFERLHRSLELVGERILSLSRERELLIGRIDEIEFLNLDLETKLSQQTEVSDSSTARLQAMEEELESGKREGELLSSSIQELQQQLNEKEAVILQQGESIESYRLQVEKFEEDHKDIGELRSRVSELEQLLEEQKSGRGDQVEEWERRIAEAEMERESVRSNVETLERERDQARATVESMIHRIQQLEASGSEANSTLIAEKEALVRDLEEALELAALHESEAEELRSQLTIVAEASEKAKGEFSVDENERNELIGQVEHAIAMIDKHLINAD
ncbi:MAG: hypothetical protein KDD67_03315 [Ignavibacteriae bacterium]|nr:hypothetical protein [Ignavibacteriota bacterium]MCB9217141.1 hypothetical protein [Ignavibacteria bacterium]